MTGAFNPPCNLRQARPPAYRVWCSNITGTPPDVPGEPGRSMVNHRNRVSAVVRRIGGMLLFLGIDPRRIAVLRFIPRYVRDRAAFRQAGGTIDHTFAILDDFRGTAGSSANHYFHQDLLVATAIRQASPARHIDVGSRIDGFVAHVASYREIEVLDIRPLPSTGHPQIRFMQADLMTLPPELEEITDSLSCLHALEHFGLGRYGDPIDPLGHRKGFENLCRLLRPGGTLYLSFPIGRPAVHFNAHRVFAPTDPVAWAGSQLNLVRFDYVDDAGVLHVQERPESIATPEYGCGIYTFRKASTSPVTAHR